MKNFFKIFALIVGINLSLALPSLGNSWGIDDFTTPGINEGAIGSGIDDFTTPGINEGAIGSGIDDFTTPDINEGAIGRW